MADPISSEIPANFGFFEGDPFLSTLFESDFEPQLTSSGVDSQSSSMQQNPLFDFPALQAAEDLLQLGSPSADPMNTFEPARASRRRDRSR